jgi:hypothetical protein
MPILHQYQDKTGWFIRTAIQNAIITFQLTAAGAKRLLESGIKDGARFRRAILFALYRSGDAYTHGTGPGIIEPYKKGQLEIDFSNDPEPETIFPRCSSCGSLSDLHFVDITKENRHYAGLYCSECRKQSGGLIDTSIPLPVVTRGILARVLELKGISELDRSALAYKESLDSAFNEKWDELLKKKRQTKHLTQGVLIGAEEKQRKLT